MTRDEVSRTTWRHIEIHRQIRNHALREYYRSDWDDRPSEFDQINKLPGWKRQWPIFKEVLAHAAQQTVSQIHTDMDILKTHRENGRNTGRLKWQGSGEFRSVAYQTEGYDVDQNTGRDGWATLTLSKIGSMPIRIHHQNRRFWLAARTLAFWPHREIPDTDAIKRVILKKETTGEWFVCLVIERAEEALPEKPALENIEGEDCIGIDLGVLSYIHTSDDLSVGRLSLEEEYDRYARAQRALDRKEHGSNNWDHQRENVAQQKRRIKRKVLDFQHKLSTRLVTEYDIVCVEDLDVKPMLETSQSAKNKQDAAWSRFIELLQYKADLYGTHVIPADPTGTTKDCSECGVETHKPIWIREHSCPACGHTEDRDLNAVARTFTFWLPARHSLATAKNILAKGLKQLFSVGQGLAESTSSERRSLS